MNHVKPPTVYTPESFLQSEYLRVRDAWFWRAFMHHLQHFADEHTRMALGLANGSEQNLRVAAAMASAYKTLLDLPEAIRSGKLLMPGQVLGNAPPRTAADNDIDVGETDGQS